MCACEHDFTRTRCAGTRLDPGYLELPDWRDDDACKRWNDRTESEADDAAQR